MAEKRAKDAHIWARDPNGGPMNAEELGPEHGMLIGRAAEHAVCADLLLTGIHATLTEQGMAFDVVADIGTKLVRIQVKGTLKSRRMRPGIAPDCWAYVWPVKHRGKERRGRRLDESHCDIVALVALDIRAIAYMPVAVASQTVQLRPPGAFDQRERWSGPGWTRTVDQFSFKEAVSGDTSGYATSSLATHCRRGHEYTEENTVRDNRHSRICRICRNEKSRKRQASLRAATRVASA